MPMTANGLAKLIEECGELVQIAGKKLAYFTTDEHPDGGAPISQRLEDEIADVLGAAKFVQETLGLDEFRIEQRVLMKLNRFRNWQAEPGNNEHGLQIPPPATPPQEGAQGSGVDLRPVDALRIDWPTACTAAHARAALSDLAAADSLRPAMRAIIEAALAAHPPQASDGAKDAERYRWLANRVLACDYGDNDAPGQQIGWRIRHNLLPVDGGRQPAFMYGASIDGAIDAELGKKS